MANELSSAENDRHGVENYGWFGWSRSCTETARWTGAIGPVLHESVSRLNWPAVDAERAQVAGPFGTTSESSL